MLYVICCCIFLLIAALDFFGISGKKADGSRTMPREWQKKAAALEATVGVCGILYYFFKGNSFITLFCAVATVVALAMLIYHWMKFKNQMSK